MKSTKLRTQHVDIVIEVYKYKKVNKYKVKYGSNK